MSGTGEVLGYRAHFFRVEGGTPQQWISSLASSAHGTEAWLIRGSDFIVLLSLLGMKRVLSCLYDSWRKASAALMLMN